MPEGAAKWDDLRVFLEVARQGSVHAAARKLRLDHSTVCRRIGKLELILSLKLIDRTRRGVVVRQEARDILRHIEGMEVHASSLQDAIARSGTDAPQIVRIATMEGIASRYVARRLPALYELAGNVTIELVSIPQTVDLSRREADIFLSFFNPRIAGLRSSLLGEFALFLYGSPDYVRRYGAPRSRQDLAHHVFVGYIEDLLAIDAVRWLDEVVTAPRMSFRSNSIIAQCSAAQSGMGLVLLPTFVAAGMDGLARVLPGEVSVRRKVWLSVRTEQSYLARIKSVSQALKQVFAGDEDFLLGKREELRAILAASTPGRKREASAAR
jgi:DNA-binding transcriptional LysR family regulator